MVSSLGVLVLGQIVTPSGTQTGAAPAATGAAPAGGAPAVETRAGTGPSITSAPGTGGVAGTTTSPGTETAPLPPPASNPLWQLLPFALMFVALYFVLFRGQRKDEKKRKSALADLKKGDRVMTIGGMIANVVSVDGDEVVLKIDESTNTKARYRKSAIQEIIGDEKK